MAEYLVFVLLGAWAAQRSPRYTASVDQRAAPLAAGVFSACLLLFMIPGVQAGFDAAGLTAMPKFIAGLLSIPAIHGLIRTTSLARSRWLLTLGYYTFHLSHEHDHDRPGEGRATEVLSLGRAELPDLRRCCSRAGCCCRF